MLTLTTYTPDLFDQWNRFVIDSNNGTIFHRLDFLAYHQDKYKDNEHHLLWHRKGKIIALLPLAIFEESGRRIARSPYGASYGGIIHKIPIHLSDVQEILSTLINHLYNQQVHELVLTLSPQIYYRQPSNYIEFCLLRNGFEQVNSDLTSYVEITKEPLRHFTRSAAKAVRKAMRNGVAVIETDDLDNFYHILIENRRKFNAVPTHSLDEVRWLTKNLSNDIKLFMAFFDKKPVAGSLVFRCNKNVLLDFYWAHLDEYSRYRPINLIVYEISRWAYEQNFKYFDFGAHTVNMKVVQGNTTFKETFGAAGIFKTTFALKLN